MAKAAVGALLRGVARGIEVRGERRERRRAEERREKRQLALIQRGERVSRERREEAEATAESKAEAAYERRRRTMQSMAGIDIGPFKVGEPGAVPTGGAAPGGVPLVRGITDPRASMALARGDITGAVFRQEEVEKKQSLQERQTQRTVEDILGPMQALPEVPLEPGGTPEQAATYEKQRQALKPFLGDIGPYGKEPTPPGISLLRARGEVGEPPTLPRRMVPRKWRDPAQVFDPVFGVPPLPPKEVPPTAAEKAKHKKATALYYKNLAKRAAGAEKEWAAQRKKDIVAVKKRRGEISHRRVMQAQEIRQMLELGEKPEVVQKKLGLAPPEPTPREKAKAAGQAAAWRKAETLAEEERMQEGPEAAGQARAAASPKIAAFMAITDPEEQRRLLAETQALAAEGHAESQAIWDELQRAMQQQGQ